MLLGKMSVLRIFCFLKKVSCCLQNITDSISSCSYYDNQQWKEFEVNQELIYKLMWMTNDVTLLKWSCKYQNLQNIFDYILKIQRFSLLYRFLLTHVCSPVVSDRNYVLQFSISPKTSNSELQWKCVRHSLPFSSVFLIFPQNQYLITIIKIL